jgi:hypothetical protein
MAAHGALDPFGEESDVWFQQVWFFAYMVTVTHLGNVLQEWIFSEKSAPHLVHTLYTMRMYTRAASLTP